MEAVPEWEKEKEEEEQQFWHLTHVHISAIGHRTIHTASAEISSERERKKKHKVRVQEVAMARVRRTVCHVPVSKNNVSVRRVREGQSARPDNAGADIIEQCIIFNI